MAKRVDANQPEIVKDLRRAGCSVLILSMVGKGCPDIAVGKDGVTYFMEIKNGELAPSKRALTPDEVQFHEEWRGHVAVVTSTEDAYRVVGLA